MKSYRCFIAWHGQQSIETLWIDSADSTKWLGEFLPAKRHCFFLIVHFDADQCEKNEWTMWTPWEMGSTHVVKSGRWFLISQVITLNMPHAQKPCEIWFLLIHEGRAVEGLIAVSKGSSEHVWNAYIFWLLSWSFVHLRSGCHRFFNAGMSSRVMSCTSYMSSLLLALS